MKKSIIKKIFNNKQIYINKSYDEINFFGTADIQMLFSINSRLNGYADIENAKEYSGIEHMIYKKDCRKLGIKLEKKHLYNHGLEKEYLIDGIKIIKDAYLFVIEYIEKYGKVDIFLTKQHTILFESNNVLVFFIKEQA